MVFRLLVAFLVTSLTLVTSLPMSSNSPEDESLLKELTEAIIESPEPVRTRRSITAFLAAEVLFLEGILAAQNTGKKNSVKKVKGRRPVNNHIHSTGVSKHSYPPPVRQDTRPPTIPSSSTTTISTTTLPISQLDPFIMLTAPDLSRPKQGLQSYTDDIFTETVVSSESQDTKREVPLSYQQSKYGEYELYNPVIFAQSSDSEELSTSTALAPSATIKNSSERRRPRKIVQKYGAFELYQPSIVIRQNTVTNKGKRDSVSVLVTARPESLSSTFFTRDQLGGSGQEWRNVRRRRREIPE